MAIDVEACYRRYGPRVLRRCRFLLRDEERAVDALHDVFVQLRTPDWLLERIALGELPPEELAAARARLAAEPGGLERLAKREADDGATLAKLPTGPLELKGGTVPLPSAYALDDAPAFERFFFVTSDEPFDMNALMDSARELAREPERARREPLPLPPQLSRSSLILEKEPGT